MLIPQGKDNYVLIALLRKQVVANVDHFPEFVSRESRQTNILDAVRLFLVRKVPPPH